MQLRGIKAQSAAAPQRAVPTARRLGWRKRNELILRGFDRHKVLQICPLDRRTGAPRYAACSSEPPTAPPLLTALGYLVSGGENQITFTLFHAISGGFVQCACPVNRIHASMRLRIHVAGVQSSERACG